MSCFPAVGAASFPSPGVSIEAPLDHSVPRELGHHVFSSCLAQLVGLSLDQSEPLELTLVWQALSKMPISYRVFVHLLNENGEITSQSDGVPDSWTRPTTGWLPGEYVIDRHTLDVSLAPDDQQLTLSIGMYDPASGTRLLTSGQEYIERVLEIGEN